MTTRPATNVRGFLYAGGKMIYLGLNVFPDAINDVGVVVGQGPGGAIADSGGAVQNLNELVPAGSGFTLTNAVGINRSGQTSPPAPTSRPARTTPSY